MFTIHLLSAREEVQRCRMDDERLLHLSDEQWAQVEAAFPQRRGRRVSSARSATAWLSRPCFTAHARAVRGVTCPTRLRRRPHDLHALEAVGEKRRAATRPGGLVSGRGQTRRVGPEPGDDRLDGGASAPARRRGTQKNGGTRPWPLAWRLEHEDPHRQRERTPGVGGGLERRAGRRCAGGRRVAGRGARLRGESGRGRRPRLRQRRHPSHDRGGREGSGDPTTLQPDEPTEYDKEKYKQRNKAERLFCKLKGYRGVATRYDKLAAMFLGGVLATLLAVSLRCIVNRL